MASLRLHESCLALRDAKYETATVLRINKKTISIRYTSDKLVVTVAPNKLWKCKRVKSKRTSQFFSAASNDKYVPVSRAQRMEARAQKELRRTPVVVHAVRYGNGPYNGDYYNMLNDPAFCKTSLCIFNDNDRQWELAGLEPATMQGAGGGNACARPWQHIAAGGHSIGICTGPFATLDDVRHISLHGEPAAPHTAREIILASQARIVRRLCAHPEKKNVYFCVDPRAPPDSREIGLAIFRGMVGDDVVALLSQVIAEIPRKVAERL